MVWETALAIGGVGIAGVVILVVVVTLCTVSIVFCNLKQYPKLSCLLPAGAQTSNSSSSIKITRFWQEKRQNSSCILRD